MNNKILLTNIQRFSLHDGPGIRTTVFLKGCSLSCPWCSNPENIVAHPQDYHIGNDMGTYGDYYTAEELLKECVKDSIYYDGVYNDNSLWSITSAADIEKLPGGVTFSGGEALIQVFELIDVIVSLHDRNIHVAVETCLFVPEKHLELALNYFDFFYVDIKILDSQKTWEVEHGSLELFLKNFNTLMSWRDAQGRRKPVVVRIPVVGTYTDSLKNRKAVFRLIEKYRDGLLKIELIQEHNLGESKYTSLGMTINYHGVSDELMKKYKDELSFLGVLTEICKI
jgi:pyruvate formate lyase activating enzyme